MLWLAPRKMHELGRVPKVVSVEELAVIAGPVLLVVVQMAHPAVGEIAGDNVVPEM